MSTTVGPSTGATAPASAPTPARPVESRDPATGNVWRTFESATEGAVRAALAAARESQRAWAAASTGDRAEVIERFRRVLVARRDDVTQTIRAESGKPAVEAMATEVMVTLDMARFLANRAQSVLAPRTFTPGNAAMWRKRVVTRREPYGVVGIISPWNYPFMLAAGITLPALVAGNGVLLKPSEFTPSSGVLLGELLVEAGLPRGLLQVLPGDGRTGATVVESGVDKVFFVGSAATGRKVASACGERLIPCALELGGSDPAIILADANLEVAASGIIWGRFSNAGQTCVAPKRVIVEHAVYDEFVELLSERVRSLKVGPAADSNTDVGAMIRPSQTAAIARQLDDALAKGAKVAARADAPQGYAAPTVLVNVTPDMLVLREETFGPLLPVLDARDANDAIRLANATSFGLSASVWGRRVTRASRVATAIDAGTVTVNDVCTAPGIAEMPYGGVKQSGIGASHGHAGLLESTREQSVIVDHISWLRQPWWFGYGADRAAGIDAYVRFWHGRTLAERLSGVARTLKLLLRHHRAI